MQARLIHYHFLIEGKESLKFSVDLKRKYSKEKDAERHPFWAALNYHKCVVCPLSGSEFHHCPVAVDLQDVMATFSDTISHRRAEMHVLTPEREFVHHCDVQTGLNSLLGLIMATSACPILSQLRPLANFHLPFATAEETLYRTVGAYLVKQYFVLQNGNKPDFELAGLGVLYQKLISLNTCFAARVRSASEQDANINAVIRMDNFSILVLFALKDNLMHEKVKFYSGYEQDEVQGGVNIAPPEA